MFNHDANCNAIRVVVIASITRIIAVIRNYRSSPVRGVGVEVAIVADMWVNVIHRPGFFAGIIV